MLDRTTPPQVKPFDFKPLPAQNVVKLPNGITLHYYSAGEQPICNLTILFSGGQSEAANSAIPDMLGSILPEGTSSYTGAAIAQTIDFNGARLTRQSNSHYSGLVLIALNDKLSELLPILGEIISSPILPNDAFESIKQSAISKLLLSQSKVSYLAEVELCKLLCGKEHPQAERNSAEKIGSIDIEQVRSFHNRRICPNGCHVFLSGKLTDDIIKCVSDFLTALPIYGCGITPIITSYTPQNAQTVIVEKKGSYQSAIEIGIPAIPRTHPDYIPLRLSVMALGGYFGSRLMSNIREEKGYTYGISSSLAGSAEGCNINISAQCDNSYTYLVIDEIRKELSDLVNNPPCGEELTRLKLNAASNLVGVLDSPISIMNYYSTKLIANIPCGYFNAQQRSIASLTPETISQMASLYMNPDNMRIAIACDSTKL